MNETRRIVLAIESYTDFAKDLAYNLGLSSVGQVARETFPDGERYQRLEEDVEGADVVVVGGTTNDAATLELYDLASGAVAHGARRLFLVIPYFGYSTMERAVKGGEIVTAKSRARLLSSIPHAGLGNHVLLMDLHSEGLPYYFDAGFHAVHVYAQPVILQGIQALALAGDGDYVLAATDTGRAKWVESYANLLGVPAVVALKRRTSGNQVEIVDFSGPVEGKHVVIYDDMIRTGGSLLEAARAYRAAGAKRIDVIATHGVFPGDALERLLSDGVICKVFVTDTHSRVLALQHPNFHVLKVAKLFRPHILRGVE